MGAGRELSPTFAPMALGFMGPHLASWCTPACQGDIVIFFLPSWELGGGLDARRTGMVPISPELRDPGRN